MPKLTVDKIETTEVSSQGDLVLKANGENFISLASGGNIEFHKPIDLNDVDLTEVDIKGGSINNTTIGLTTQLAGRFSSLTAVGNTFCNGNIEVGGNAQLSGGLLVNSTATFNNPASFNGTLDLSSSTLTLADNQISGDKVEGGTINSITIESLGGALDCNNQAFTNVNIDSGVCEGMDITVGTGKTLTLTAGTLTTSAAQKIAIVEGCASNLDIGSYLLRASTLQADSQTEGRVCVYGSAGLLSEDADLRVNSAGAVICAKPLTVQNTLTSKISPYNEGGHSADKVITASQLLNKIWRGAPTANKNLTFPTASDLVSAVKDCAVGASWDLYIINNSSGGGKDYTLVSGTGMNYISSGAGGHNKVGAGKCRQFIVVITNIGSGTEAYDVYAVSDHTPI